MKIKYVLTTELPEVPGPVFCFFFFGLWSYAKVSGCNSSKLTLHDFFLYFFGIFSIDLISLRLA